MNDISAPAARRTPRTWLPAVIAIAVTAACSLLALGSLASGALDDGPPYPHLGWLSAGLYAQAALGITAITLLILSLTRASGRRIVSAPGWAVITRSVTSIIVSTMLGGPTHPTTSSP